MNPAARKRSRAVPAGILLVLAAVFAALGVWQVERREWKHALIASVEGRVHAEAQAAPGPADWASLTAEKDAYRHVRVSGHFLPGKQTLVRAVSDLGSGYWVMTPLDTGKFTVLVNRGFISQEQRKTIGPEPAGAVMMTGLLRISEPGGGFLRRNDPAGGQWYSRDVAAIALTQGLTGVAPYFIDAADRAGASAPGQPVGGLTVVRFADNHASYALTWFAMSLLSIGAAWYMLRGKLDSA